MFGGRQTVAQKARVKAGTAIAVINRAPGIVESLGLPEGVVLIKPAKADLVFLFVRTRAELTARMPRRSLPLVLTRRFGSSFGRNLKYLITLLDDLQVLGVAFVGLNEGIDATTPAGRLQMHVLRAIAEFERGWIVERIAGLARAMAQGKRH